MRHVVALTGLAIAGIVAMAGAGPAVAADVRSEPPIELPKFEVVDSRLLPPVESWSYAEIPGFEILSSVSARETRRFTRDFLLLQEVIQAIMPAMSHGRGDVPTALVLCGRGNDFSAFLPQDRTDQEFSTNSLFFEDAERTAIVIDFALAELQLDADTRIEADPYRSFYREYFRHLIRRQIGRNAPPWLEEGLVQLFAGIDFDKKWISFGLVGDGFGGEKPGDFNRMLVQRRLMPFDEMFAMEPAQRDAHWAAQCYAFVHMCLYASGKPYQKAFIEFISRLQKEAVSEKLFQDCFHRNYRQIATELRGYLQYTAHTYVEFKAKKGQELPEPPPIAIRDATASEVGRIKGETLRLGGHDDAAHLTLIAPYVRGEREPRLLAALGLDEARAGHDDRARKFLEEAAREKAVRARAYLELARLRYEEALKDPKEAGKLSREQIEYVQAPLLTARTQPPPLPGEYALLADIWTHAAIAPTREQFAVLLEGVAEFPRDPNLAMQVAVLGAKHGFEKEARAVAEFGQKAFADLPAQAERFAMLIVALGREEKPVESAKK